MVKKLNECTVMLVDDVKENIDALVMALEDAFDLSIALDGQSALDIAMEEPPDIILLDVMMPEMDGYEVIARLKGDDRTKNIPVIFITGLNDPADEARGIDLGAVDFITKPFNARIVKQRVTTNLSLRLCQEALASA